MVNDFISAMIRQLPTGVSFELTKSMAERPDRRPLRDDDTTFISAANTFVFGRSNRKSGWSAGAGPSVIVVHGWAGRSSQMIPLATRLINDGFTVWGFDATGHGASAGRRVSFAHFARDIAEFGEHVARQNGPVHGYVGHSSGGLLMMSARELYGLRGLNYACLNAPRAPYAVLEAIDNALRPTPEVAEKLAHYYSESLGYSWEEMKRGDAFRPLGDERLFLCYDVDDPQVDHSDSTIIRPLWPACEVVLTHGLGHMKPLRDPNVVDAVSNFLGP